MTALHKKCPNADLFLVLIFLYLECSTNTGKYGPEITPYLDTFYAVQIFKTFVIHIQWLQRYTDNKFRDHLLSVYLYLENSSSYVPRKHFLVLSQKKETLNRFVKHIQSEQKQRQKDELSIYFTFILVFLLLALSM